MALRSSKLNTWRQWQTNREQCMKINWTYLLRSTVPQLYKTTIKCRRDEQGVHKAPCSPYACVSQDWLNDVLWVDGERAHIMSVQHPQGQKKEDRVLELQLQVAEGGYAGVRNWTWVLHKSSRSSWLWSGCLVPTCLHFYSCDSGMR